MTGLATARQDRVFATGSMGRSQVAVVVVMTMLNLADGFDVLVMSLAAPGVAKQFELSAAEIGLLFSVGFMGMAAGAFLLSPLADRFGRRPTLVVCLILMMSGMVLSALSPSPLLLSISRIVTGLGVGAMLPTLNTVVAEFASERRRGMSISAATTGFAIGGLLGSLVAAALIVRFGWQSVFLAGACLNLACLAAVFLFVPESADWLIERRPAGALERLNAVLRRTGRASMTTLPPIDRANLVRSGTSVTASAIRRPLLLLSLAYFLAMIGFYSFVSWLPKLMIQRGLPIQDAMQAISFLTGGSIVGGLAFSFVAQLTGIRLGAILLFTAEALCLSAFSTMLHRPQIASALLILFGVVHGAALVSLYASLAEVFPAGVRSSATGAAVGTGRIGAIVGPLLCGLLVSAGAGEQATYLSLAACMALAGFSFIALQPLGQASVRQSNPVDPHPETPNVNPVAGVEPGTDRSLLSGYCRGSA